MASTLCKVVSGPSPEQYILVLNYDLSCQLKCCHLVSARMLASELFTGQDKVQSRSATVTADLGNLTQKVISISVLLTQSLSVPFRTRIVPDTSFLGSDSLCKGCMLVG